MLYEETASACTETTVHLHRDSGEVACLGDQVTAGCPGA
jgi:hypothetical protein